ncbi:MAG: ZIP family metal transporter [Rubrobacteraceae bacterium]
MFLQAFLFTLIPLLAAVAGSVLAFYWTPGPEARSYIQHFAAGVVLAAVTGELLPKVVEGGQHVGLAVVGFLAGLGVMLAIKLLSHGGGTGAKGSVKAGTHGGGAISLSVTAGVDTLVDGFVIGLGFVVGGGAGPLLALALAVELFFLSLSAAAAIGQPGRSRRWVIWVGLGLGFLVMAGAMLGVALLGGAPAGLVIAVLAFGSVALLYLVTEELLVSVRNVSETPWHTLVLFTGFISVFVVEMLVH